ncbi:hypothetical protein MP228_010651 [Amoeboaphelidium protococcarum]|nr:hypothetical protein MP228_010651 [Amoeboaphelidium protococcarum]
MTIYRRIGESQELGDSQEYQSSSGQNQYVFPFTKSRIIELFHSVQKSLYYVELIKLLRLSVPLVLTYWFFATMSLVSMHYVGQSGDVTALAGISLAFSLYNAIGYSVGYGMCGGLDTLVAQSVGMQRRGDSGSVISQQHLHGGSSRSRQYLGTTLAKALVIIWITCIPICLTLCFCAPILIDIMRQPYEVAMVAQTYCRWSSPAIPLFMTFEVYKRYIQCHGDTTAAFISMLIGCLVNWMCHYVMVGQLKMGYVGAAISLNLAYGSLVVSVLVYLRYIANGRIPPIVFSRNTFKGWTLYYRLALPNTLMICAEWWAFEICALLAGSIGPISLSAHSIVQNTVYSMYMIPYGLSIASGVTIGNYLGANDAIRSKIVVRLSLAITILSMLVNSTILIANGDRIANAFLHAEASQNQQQSAETAQASKQLMAHFIQQLLPVCAFYQVFDGVQTLSQSILRACGRQEMGAVFTLGCYYLICVPLGYVMAFGYGFSQQLQDFASSLMNVAASQESSSSMIIKVGNEPPANGFGVLGLWIGIATAILCLGISIGIFVLRLDWAAECEAGAARIAQDSAHMSKKSAATKDFLNNDVNRS